MANNNHKKLKAYAEYSKEQLLVEIEELNKRKKYGLVWEEQEEKFDKDTIGKLPVLKEIKNKEIATDKKAPVNLLIEGDNYHSLSVLNYTHEKSVDVIYIDPPYNTGKEDFKYNDEWVNEDDAYRHSKWLSFMSKRLKLASALLKDDGIVFISIDENESAQLKLLCDEIFGENNRLSTQHIQVRYGSKNLNERKDFQELIEYTLAYAKDKYFFEANKPTEEYDLEKFNLEIKELKKPDKTLEINGRKVDIFFNGSYFITKKDKGDINLFKETWLSGSIYSGTGHGTTYQKIVEKRVKEDGLSTLYKIYGLGEDGLGFRYMINPQRESSSRGKMFTKIPLEKKEALKNGSSEIYRPIINFYDFSPDFGNIRHEGGVGFNAGKKPVKMLKQFINYHKNKNATVLDFFAGSGSTGHAVLALNAEDGGSRQFILTTNNEGDICTEVCYPRIKNVIKGWNSNDGLGGNLKYFKTSFVDATPNDQNKRKLTEQSTEMLCVRENTFEPVLEKAKIKVFRNKKQHTAIIFDQDLIPDFKKMAKTIEGPIHTYIFTLEDEDFSREFKELDGRIVVSPIPEAILRVYRRIFSIKI